MERPNDPATRARYAAVRFFLDDLDRARRALWRHRPDKHDHCSGCSAQPPWHDWPCQIHRLALAALELASSSDPRPQGTGR